MRDYVDMLGLIFMVYGGIELVISLGVGLLYVLVAFGIGGIGVVEGDLEALFVGGTFGVVGLLAVAFATLVAGLNIAAGWGVRQRRPWARLMAMVLGCLSLPSVPFGTALGLFALVTLIDQDVTAEFADV